MAALLAGLLKAAPKTPLEIVSKCVSAFEALEIVKNEESKIHDKCLESIAKYLGQMKTVVYGDEEADAKRDEAEKEKERERRKNAAIELCNEAVKTQLLTQMVVYLKYLDFELRKDVAQMFGVLVRIKDAHDVAPGAQYVLKDGRMLNALFNGYDDASIALQSGAMLRDCLKDESLARDMLNSLHFRDFFKRIEVPNFEVASDAFSTFKDLLTRHKAVVSAYLQEHYEEFFGPYHGLLKSTNYVTRRQSLKLLGELLLDRSNVRVMVRFVGDVEFLKTLMQLLKDPSKSIQFEAFTVFKVFAANPNKPQVIALMLGNNKDKLLKYLEDFHAERSEHDEQFKEEKAVVIKAISSLPSVSTPTPSASSSQLASQASNAAAEMARLAVAAPQGEGSPAAAAPPAQAQAGEASPSGA